MTGLLPRAAFLASLPRKRVTAGALIRDGDGRVLLVEPTYRPDWLLPGGSVEADESPARGAEREVLEELGVAVPIGRPLVLQWLREAEDDDGVLHFVYDGGVVDRATVGAFRLPPDELRSFRFVEPEEVAGVASPRTAARIGAGLRALSLGTLVELGR